MKELLLFIFSFVFHQASPIPVAYTIPQRTSECLYERLEESEFVTFSVFIGSGKELKAIASLEGPVAQYTRHDAGSGSQRGGDGGTTPREIMKEVARYNKGARYGQQIAGGNDQKRTGIFEISITQTIDFEDDQFLGIDDDDDDDDDDDFVDDDDDDDAYMFMDDDVSVQETEMKRQELKRRKMEDMNRRQKQKVMAKLSNQHQRNGPAKLNVGEIREEGDPWQVTSQAKAGGWYRACVKANWSQVTAELDLRKSSEMGKPHHQTGHVMTHEQRSVIADEQKIKDDLSKEIDQTATDEDIKETQEYLTRITRQMEQIKRRQQMERRMMDVHNSINEHSHSSMVVRSLVETVCFIVVTSFQIYVVKKWFESSTPLLGR